MLKMSEFLKFSESSASSQEIGGLGLSEADWTVIKTECKWD